MAATEWFLTLGVFFRFRRLRPAWYFEELSYVKVPKFCGKTPHVNVLSMEEIEKFKSSADVLI